MFSSMAQPHSRHHRSGSRSRSVTRSGVTNYDRVTTGGSRSLKPAFYEAGPQHISHRSRSTSSNPPGVRRRSSSATRRPHFHVSNSSNHHQQMYSNPYHSSSRQEGSDSGSVSSAPSSSLRYNELREPQNTKSAAKNNKYFRDESPAGTRRHAGDTQKHIKIARRIIEGTLSHPYFLSEMQLFLTYVAV